MSAPQTAQKPITGSVPTARIRNFRPDIEALRTIAVLAVLVYHLRSSWLPGGFVGVDIFFVISGFLITSHLIKEWEKNGRISLTRFYARRMVRLVPAATVVLVATAAATALFVPRSLWQQIGIDIAASAGYVVNWVFAGRSIDYLAEDAVESPVQHFWSLAVEEQYYVIWPLLIIIAGIIAVKLGRKARNTIAVAAGIVIVVSFALAMLAIATGDVTAYFSTFTRLWELAVGALVAATLPHLQKLHGHLIATLGYYAGLILLAISVIFITGDAAWPGPLTLLPVIGTALAITFGGSPRPSVLERALSIRPIVWVGGISYSLYLWHWPLIIIAGYVFTTLGVKHLLIIAVASVALAWASGKFVENPIRFSSWAKGRPRNGLTLGLGMGAFAAILGLILALVSGAGASTVPAGAKAEGAAVLSNPVSDTPLDILTAQPEWMLPAPLDAADDVPELYADGCQQNQTDATAKVCDYGDENADRTILIVGDSKANQWLPAFDAIGQEAGYRVSVMTKSACSFSDAPAVLQKKAYPSCDSWNRNADDVIAEMAPDVLVTSMVSSVAFVGTTGQDARQLMIDGVESKLARAAESAGAVVVLGDTLHPSGTVYRCVDQNLDDVAACSFDRPRAIKASALSTQTAAVEALGGSVITGDSGTTAGTAGAPLLLDMNDAICPPQAIDGCPAVIGNSLIYRQGSHVTATYVTTLAPVLERRLVDAGVLTQK